MGKLAAPELKELLACIRKDPRVLIPPQVGFDAGVHRLGDEYIAVATDPCIGVPWDWFGFLLVNYAASDVALFGAKPEFCTITLMGPNKTKAEEFQEIMMQTSAAANELGIAIVRGHTATYDGICELVGICTAYGRVNPEQLVTPKGACPGDLLVCTKPIGLETAVNFALTHGKAAKELFGEKAAHLLGMQVPLQSCVKEALQLARLNGVHAMHDATEGGLVSAVNELADASGLGFEVEFGKVPFLAEVNQLQKFFSFSDEQKMAMSSAGTIISAVDPRTEQRVAKTLAHLGLTSSVIGVLSEKTTRTLNIEGKGKKFPRAAVDPYAKIMATKP